MTKLNKIRTGEASRERSLSGVFVSESRCQGRGAYLMGRYSGP